tara:strand:- start:721 stop:1014 length:294 start_codon:yes stop_codon:yes gene_type:complete
MGTTTEIDYITIASLGNAADFGDLTTSAQVNLGSVSSGTRGVWGGGNTAGTEYVDIHYITFSTLGNSVDFGDIQLATRQPNGVSNGTRGVFCGGYAD